MGRAIVGTIGERLMNLKHFIGMMRIENIFRKFIGPYQQNGVVMEDLAAGLSQLGYPLIKSLAMKNIAGVDLAGNQLYKYQDIAASTIYAEMEAITAMDIQGQPAKLIRKI